MTPSTPTISFHPSLRHQNHPLPNTPSLDSVLESRREELARLKALREEKDRETGGVEKLLERARMSITPKNGGSSTRRPLSRSPPPRSSPPPTPPTPSTPLVTPSKSYLSASQRAYYKSMISTYTPGSRSRDDHRRTATAGGSARLIRKLREEQEHRESAVRRIKELEEEAAARRPFEPQLPKPRANLSPTQGGGEDANEAQAVGTNDEAARREREMMEELADLRRRLASQKEAGAAQEAPLEEREREQQAQTRQREETPAPPKRTPPSPTLVRELESLRKAVASKSQLEVEAKEENSRLMERVREVEIMRAKEEELRREEEERRVKAEEDRARASLAAAEALRKADSERRVAELAQAEALAQAKAEHAKAKKAEEKYENDIKVAYDIAARDAAEAKAAAAAAVTAAAEATKAATSPTPNPNSSPPSTSLSSPSPTSLSPPPQPSPFSNNQSLSILVYLIHKRTSMATMRWAFSRLRLPTPPPSPEPLPAPATFSDIALKSSVIIPPPITPNSSSTSLVSAAGGISLQASSSADPPPHNPAAMRYNLSPTSPSTQLDALKKYYPESTLTVLSAFTTPLASYTIREMTDASPSDLPSAWEDLTGVSDHKYSLRFDPRDPSTVDVSMEATADSSRFLLTGPATLIQLHSPPSSSEAPSDSDSPPPSTSHDLPTTGTVCYIDYEGAECTYDLNDVADECLSVRAGYCTGIIAAASALRDRGSREGTPKNTPRRIIRGMVGEGGAREEEGELEKVEEEREGEEGGGWEGKLRRGVIVEKEQGEEEEAEEVEGSGEAKDIEEEYEDDDESEDQANDDEEEDEEEDEDGLDSWDQKLEPNGLAPPPTNGLSPPPTNGLAPPPTNGLSPPPTNGLAPPPTALHGAPPTALSRPKSTPKKSPPPPTFQDFSSFKKKDNSPIAAAPISSSAAPTPDPPSDYPRSTSDLNVLVSPSQTMTFKLDPSVLSPPPPRTSSGGVLKPLYSLLSASVTSAAIALGAAIYAADVETRVAIIGSVDTFRYTY
ncbi:hypothetical protein TrCOL_g358 [Triparma columacea]|uniref:Uncharacterized protein n=1 Tax=Triparma columacea TaxID=722753 RepID=A0A9W7LCH7_9STRA|nr:hypothetical protein TrCOL_g358 [Triparma columacea]